MTGVTPEAEVEILEALPSWERDDRTVHQRMAHVLAELPAIGKTQENRQQGFMFRGHDDVLNALNPLLAKHGVFVVPDVLERVTGERTTSGGKTMYEVNLHVAFDFYGANGDHLRASTWGEGTDMGDKATSKALTMAFKYVLAQAFAVSTEEAYDPDAGSPEATTRGTRGATRTAAAQPELALRPTRWTGDGSWQTLMGEHGVPRVEASEWLAQAVAAAGIDKETQAGKEAMFKGAIVALNELVKLAPDNGVQFVVGARAIIRAAFKAGFGVEVAGPEWRLDPEETDRLTYADHQGDKLGAEAASEEQQAQQEQIADETITGPPA